MKKVAFLLSLFISAAIAQPISSPVGSPFNSPVGSVTGNDNALQFFADLTENNYLAKGAGTFTPPSIGDSDGNRLRWDTLNSRWEAVKAEQTRRDGRMVMNLLPVSEDFSDAEWGHGANFTLTHGITDPNGGTTATTVTATANNGFFGDALTQTNGNTYIGSMWVKRRTGTGDVFLTVGDNVNTDITASVTSEWKRLSAADQVSSTAVRLYVQLGTSGDEVDIAFAQVEDATGRLDLTTPSEYISSGKATGQELTPNGGFDSDTDGYASGIPSVGVLSWDSGKAVLTNAATGFGRFTQTDGLDLIVGATYIAEVDAATGGTLGHGLSISPNINGTSPITSTQGAAGDTLSIIFQATATTMYTACYINSASAGSAHFDNLTVRRIDHGANVDSVQYFNYENPNTVTSNIVTDSGDRILIGRNLVSNNGLKGEGTVIGEASAFTTTTGWTAGDAQAAISVNSGNIRVTNSDASQAYMYTSYSTVIDRTYTVFINTAVSSGAFATYIGTAAGAGNLNANIASSNTLDKFTFTATGTTTYLSIYVTDPTLNNYSEIKGIYIGTPINGTFMEGAATNLISQPRDLTHSDWVETGTSVAALDAVGIDGQPNSASTLTDDNASSVEYLTETVVIPDDSNTNRLTAYIPKDSDTSRFVLLALTYTGGTTVNQYVHINTSTGELTDIAGNVDGSSIIESVGAWWRYTALLANNGTGNTTATIQPVPADGSVAGTRDSTHTGSVVIDSLEFVLNSNYPTSPLLNTGGHARLADIEATLNVNNWPDTHGSMEFYLTPEFDVGLPGSQGIVTVNPSTWGIFLTSTAKQIQLYDGTNFPAYNSAWSVAGQTIHVKMRWNATTGKMNISVDGVAATEGTFDGSFSPSGAITLFKSLTLGAYIKGLKIYRKDKGALWLTD